MQFHGSLSAPPKNYCSKCVRSIQVILKWVNITLNLKFCTQKRRHATSQCFQFTLHLKDFRRKGFHETHLAQAMVRNPAKGLSGCHHNSIHPHTRTDNTCEKSDPVRVLQQSCHHNGSSLTTQVSSRSCEPHHDEMCRYRVQ